jgi:hypothetical protein
MRVKVTQKHIDDGNTTCFACPIALALREVEGANWAHVYSRSAILDLLPGKDLYFLLPEEAQKFVGAFDNGEDVRPCEFDLIPCSSQEQDDAEPLP